jgi:Ca2+-binding EF-hand superfamily protein
MSPKREYAPFEVCLNSNFYDSIEMNKENNNNNVNNSNFYYNKNNVNTLNQNFSTNNDKNINKTNQFNENLNNSQNYNNNNYILEKKNITDNKNNNNNYILEENNISESKKEPSANYLNTNQNLINSYEYLKNVQNEKKNINKNKNEYEEGQFIDYLKEAMMHESKIEKLKIDLSLRSDFNWEEVFRIFELEGRGFLSKEDLIIGFNKFGIYPKDLDISLLLKRYDLKKEGFISYPNFFDLIVPFSKYHRIMVDKRKINTENVLNNPNEFSRETLDCIRSLFVAIFNGEFILNKLKESYTSLKIKFNDIFKLLDPNGTGFFGEKELAIFLQKNGIFNNSNDCDLIFLRLNKLRNGKIDFQEMTDEIEAVYE